MIQHTAQKPEVCLEVHPEIVRMPPEVHGLLPRGRVIERARDALQSQAIQHGQPRGMRPQETARRDVERLLSGAISR